MPHKKILISAFGSSNCSDLNTNFLCSDDSMIFAFELYRYILEDPFESFWFECIGIIMGYLQILLYLIDKTVNK